MCDDKSRYTAKNKLSNKSQESKLQVLAETSHRKGRRQQERFRAHSCQGPHIEKETSK